LHVDACLGGFVLCFGNELGVEVPPFDFSLPGVTSISADTHKYGFGLKGSSVLLYRSAEARRHQYFAVNDWPGGLYTSPGMSGSRSGGIIAAAWAAMVTLGLALGILMLAYVLIFSEVMHRSYAALLGAVVMVMLGGWAGFYSQEAALLAIDGNTMFLLMAMMMPMPTVPPMSLIMPMLRRPAVAWRRCALLPQHVSVRLVDSAADRPHVRATS
jgi:hypothetical protein